MVGPKVLYWRAPNTEKLEHQFQQAMKVGEGQK